MILGRKLRIQEAQAGGNGGGYPGGGYPGGGYPGGGGRYPGGGYPGGGYPGGGYPGGGRPRGGQDDGGRNTENDERIQELIRPAGSLSFALKNAEVDVTDDQYRMLVFYTDGRQLQKSANENHQEIAAHWNGGQLCVGRKKSAGRENEPNF